MKKIKQWLCDTGVFFTMALVLLCFGILHIVQPDLTFSQRENRPLQQRPHVELAGLLDGSFQKQSEAWASDQFFARTAFVQMKSNLVALLGKRELQGVILGKDGILFQKIDAVEEATIQQKAELLNSFAKQHKDISISMMLVPNKAAIWKEKLPDYEREEHPLEDIQSLHRQLDDSIQWIDVVETFQEHRKEELYYASDHHWTSLGASYAFDVWRRASKHEEATSYTVYTVNADFYGTLANTSGYYKGKKDHVDIYVPEKEQDVIVTYVEEQKRSASVFEKDKAASANPYEVFFGGNHGRMQIDTATPGRHLLVIKDSYANCFLPFLLPYYRSITIVDPRYYYDDVTTLIKEQDIQEVLFLYNANTFFADTSLQEIIGEE